MQVAANSFTRMWDDCRDDVLEAVARVGSSGWYVLGDEVAGFENDLAQYCGVADTIGCGNGMDAIEIALRLHGIGPGDEVLTTPLSAFATALAIVRVGAVPVFCDVDQHGLLDPDMVAAAFDTYPNIRAILPVHLYGNLADINSLSALAAARNVPLIEDAAQAIGARREEIRVAGSQHIACLSFYPTKNLGTIGDGGALLLPQNEQAETARSLRNYGQTKRYTHDLIGLNSRLDELHAAMLRSAFLTRLDGWLARRRAIAMRYFDGIANPAVSMLIGPDPDGGARHLFPVLVEAAQRDEFVEYLTANGIQAGIHYPILISDQKALLDQEPPRVAGPLTNAARYANCEVSLPINPYLLDAEADHVIGVVNDWKG